mmetsp:Transcript_31024/g.99512  ORF Transcript_31024/g.99512 Transcript_31024/m.99512 type:complete len:265 (+) Transcript_31024:918-1712(+)
MAPSLRAAPTPPLLTSSLPSRSDRLSDAAAARLAALLFPLLLALPVSVPTTEKVQRVVRVLIRVHPVPCIVELHPPEPSEDFLHSLLVVASVADSSLVRVHVCVAPRRRSVRHDLLRGDEEELNVIDALLRHLARGDSMQVLLPIVLLHHPQGCILFHCLLQRLPRLLRVLGGRSVVPWRSELTWVLDCAHTDAVGECLAGVEPLGPGIHANVPLCACRVDAVLCQLRRLRWEAEERQEGHGGERAQAVLAREEVLALAVNHAH